MRSKTNRVSILKPPLQSHLITSYLARKPMAESEVQDLDREGYSDPEKGGFSALRQPRSLASPFLSDDCWWWEQSQPGLSNCCRCLCYRQRCLGVTLACVWLALCRSPVLKHKSLSPAVPHDLACLFVSLCGFSKLSIFITFKVSIFCDLWEMPSL